MVCCCSLTVVVVRYVLVAVCGVLFVEVFVFYKKRCVVVWCFLGFVICSLLFVDC